MTVVARSSRVFHPTLREGPADAVTPSHQLLVRAGFIRQSSAGLYTYLPLGWRTVRKLERIIRDEMEAAGGQEFLLPGLQSAELWHASGRWDSVDETMFRLHDRRGSEFCLAMTHEESFTALARGELRSYRQVPQIWYQIGTKFRDEPRPRAGLLRVREFVMKDAYSFDRDSEGLDIAFATMRAAYERIYARCGLETFAAQAFSGVMGGNESIEFVAHCEAGEDEVVRCRGCGYTANVEVAESRIPPIRDELPDTDAPQPFATPGILTIESLSAAPYYISPERQLKTMVYMADEQPVVAVLRGDHTLNEAKLQLATGASRVRAADVAEIVSLMGAHPGSLGAVRLSGAAVLVDSAVVGGRVNMVTGANRDGFHLRGVDVARDLLQQSGGRPVDLRRVAAGEGCSRCPEALESFPALEVGHIFKLGTRYSARLGATVLDESGAEIPLMMGSYGIGLGRLLAAVVERHHDADGIVWPVALAPYAATVLTLGIEPELATLADRVISDLVAAGLDVLYDDRDVRAGVKFKDADLIGIPVRVSVGARALATGAVEWKLRGAAEAEHVRIDDVPARARAALPERAARLRPRPLVRST